MSCIVVNRNNQEQGRKLKKFSNSAEISLVGLPMLDEGHKSSHALIIAYSVNILNYCKNCVSRRLREKPGQINYTANL